MQSIQTSGYELPDLYHKDLLHVMVRDAHTLFVYWEISNRKRWLVSQHLQSDWGTAPKILRVYDVTCIYFQGSNANSFFDLETTPEANSWYVIGVNANATYVVDFGVFTYERQFIPLLRSNFVVTPRDTEALWGAPIITTVPEVKENYNGNAIPVHYSENFSPYSID